MKILVIGLGSMGKRRIRNLLHLGCTDIVGFDPRPDRVEEARLKYGIETMTDLPADRAVDAWIISTPPDLHVRYARQALETGRHFFAEAGVVDDGLKDLIRLAASRPHLVAAPSCTLRYHPAIRQVRAFVDTVIGVPLTFTYHSGQYLPDWHPWEDYRTFYASRRDTGACREIVPFELGWLTWMLGPIRRIDAMRGKLSDLDCDIDDVYQVLLRFRSGLLGHLQVDVVARPAVRHFRLCGSRGTVEWNGEERVVRCWHDGAWEQVAEPSGLDEPGYRYAEDMYIDEMRDFLAACRGERPWPYTLAEDAENLRLLQAAERSSDREAHANSLVV